MTFETEVLADSPWMWWDTRLAVGSAQPDSAPGNAITGTIIGSPTQDADGLHFDGVADGIECDVATNPTIPFDEFAMEFVIQPVNATGYFYFGGFQAAVGNDYLALEANGSTVDAFWYGGAGETLTGASGGLAAALQHWVFEFDGTDYTIYKDGAVYATVADSDDPIFGSSQLFRFMYDDLGSFADALGRHAIFYNNHALGPTRVAAHATAALGDDPFPGPPLALLDIDAQILPLSTGTPAPPPVTAVGQQTRWRVVCRDIEGGYRAEYPTALVVSITWNPPNTPNEAVVQIPLDETNTQAINQDNAPHREIEIWRNDVLIFTGPPVLIRADSGTRMMTVTLKDPTWYFTRRYIGNWQRTNLLTNGSFESNGTGWTEFDPNSSLTVTFDSSKFYVGTKSLKFVGSNVNEARFYYQGVTVTGGPFGTPITLSGYCYIDQWLRPGAYGGGLLLLRRGVTGPQAYSVAEVVSSTPRKKWQRLQTSVRMKPDATEQIEAWVFAIGGTIFWDDVRLVKGEAVEFAPGTDQGAIVSALVNYFQGKGPFGALAPEKSDLHVTPVMLSTGNLMEGRQYLFSDHQKAYDGTGAGATGVLDEWLNRAHGIDWRFEPASRILRGYYPAAGTVRDTVTFTWRNFPDEPAQNSAWGIIGWNYAASIDSAANQITELGGRGGQKYEGDPSREEGGATDDAALGGLTLELVETANPKADQNQLNDIAEGRLAQLKYPVATPQLVVAEPRDPVSNEVVYPLIGWLLPGDTILVDVLDGSFAMEGEYKVAQVVLDAQAETLTVTPNPVPA